MERELIDRVRRFNRTVTQRVGALDEAYLSQRRPLGLARLLWEIGPDGVDVRSLRARMGLDSGYLSRQLRRLEADGLVTTDPHETDGRVRTVRLTAAGTAERSALDRSSDALATSILEPLDPRQRERLARAMGEVERLFLASQVRIEITDPRQPDARSCLRAYFDELAQRFDDGFDPALSTSANDDELTLPRGLFLLAMLHGSPVGCGVLKLHPDSASAEIKRMWTAPAVRGLGLGRQLLIRLEQEAAKRGARTVRLDTNQTLEEAIRLYQDSGYRAVAPFNDNRYAHHWFEKVLDDTADPAR